MNNESFLFVSVHNVSGLVDNAADSDSEDEWNYIKGEVANKENIPPQPEKEVNLLLFFIFYYLFLHIFWRGERAETASFLLFYIFLNFPNSLMGCLKIKCY